MKNIKLSELKQLKDLKEIKNTQMGNIKGKGGLTHSDVFKPQWVD